MYTLRVLSGMFINSTTRGARQGAIHVTPHQFSYPQHPFNRAWPAIRERDGSLVPPQLYLTVAHPHISMHNRATDTATADLSLSPRIVPQQLKELFLLRGPGVRHSFDALRILCGKTVGLGSVL